MIVFYREFALADKSHDIPGRDLGRMTDQLAEVVEEFALVSRVLRTGVLLAQNVHPNHDFRQFDVGIDTHLTAPTALVNVSAFKPQESMLRSCQFRQVRR